MFGFIKDFINEYKLYKTEKAVDDLETQKFLENCRIESERKSMEREAENDRKLKENVVYNENDNMYHFDVTEEYNGVPHTFSCSGRTEEDCRNVAIFTLLRAHMYKTFGTTGYENM